MRIKNSLAIILLAFPVFSIAQNVGINVDTPAVELDIRPIGPSNAAQLNIGSEDNSYFLRLFSGRDGVPYSLIYWRDTYPLVFGAGSENSFVEKMRLTSSGDIGIGINPPTSRVHASANSTIFYPHIRLTEEGDDFARFRMESTAFPNAFWDIAALTNTNLSNAKLNFFYTNGTIGADRMTILGSGNVGLGITAPAVRLDVGDIIRVGGNTWPTVGKGVELAYDPNNNIGFIQVYDRGLAEWGDLFLGSGNVGIGTISPQSLFHVNGPSHTRLIVEANSNDPSIQLTSDATSLLTDWILSMDVSQQDRLEWKHNGFTRMAMTSTGQVTIGAVNAASDYLLSVDGKIIAEEMRVQPSGVWPDYVFESDYPLLGLDEVEASIRANKRLPGMPPASEIAENGIALGEMQTLVVEKLEELTLYVIELNNRVNHLEKENAQLKHALNQH